MARRPVGMQEVGEHPLATYLQRAPNVDRYLMKKALYCLGDKPIFLQNS